MGASIEGSFHMAKNYIFGILCGILVGSVSAFFSAGKRRRWWNRYDCGFISVQPLPSARCRGAVLCRFFSILLTQSAVSLWRLALNQAGGMFLGLFVALVVNLLIMPPNYAGKILQLYRSLGETIVILPQSERKRECLGTLEYDVRALQRYITLYAAEPKFLREKQGKSSRFQSCPVFFRSCWASWKVRFAFMKTV